MSIGCKLVLTIYSVTSVVTFIVLECIWSHSGYTHLKQKI